MIERHEAFIILTPGFAASEADSNCLPMQEQFVKKISNLNPQLKVFVLSFQYPYHANQYKWNGITIVPFDGRNKGGLHRLLLRKKVEAVLGKIANQYNIRGLLSFWLNECALVGKKFGMQNGIPHYCWVLGQDAREGNKYVKRTNAVGTDLIALSQSLQERFNKNYGIRPFKVIQPGMDPLSNPKRFRNIDILGVGSLIPLKHFEIFIEIVAGLRENSGSVKAVLVGEGNERKKLEALVRKYGLEENLELKGSIAHGDVLELMQRSRLLIHPSEYEGFSGVCMEALNCGAHVLSFCKPMEDAIDHWHVADSEMKMKQMALDLLGSDLDHEPVVISEIRTTVEKMMRLYHLQ